MKPTLDSIKTYHPVAIALHWLMLLGLACATVMALIMVDMPGITPTKLRLFNYHKWLGVALWCLVVVRLLWRWIVAAPPLPAHMKLWEVRVAQAMHFALYILMFSIPVAGYCYSLVAGFPVVWFGVLELPVLMAPNPELKPVLKSLHSTLGLGLWCLVGLHALAGLKHWLVNKDGVMQRMLPFLKQKK
jgi:cytochrome b561